MRLTGDRDEWPEDAVDQVHDVKSALSEEIGVHQADQAAAERGVHRDHGRSGRVFPLVAADAESAAKIIHTKYQRVKSSRWRTNTIISLVFRVWQKVLSINYLPELKASHPHQSINNPMSALVGLPRGIGSRPLS